MRQPLDNDFQTGRLPICRSEHIDPAIAVPEDIFRGYFTMIAGLTPRESATGQIRQRELNIYNRVIETEKGDPSRAAFSCCEPWREPIFP